MKSVQFNLRQLLTAVLVCSVVFAISAPLLRQLPEQRVIWMGLALGAAAAAFCLAMLRLVLKRQRFEAAAGKIHLQLRQPPRGAGVILAFAAAIELLIIAAMALGGGGFIGTIAPVLLAVCVAPTWSRAAILYAWDIGENTLELCEHAMIVGGLGYYPWGKVKSYAWSEARCPPVLWLVLDDRVLGAVVALPERQEIEPLLAAKIFQAERRNLAVAQENETVSGSPGDVAQTL
jgi:hypothetical protein